MFCHNCQVHVLERDQFICSRCQEPLNMTIFGPELEGKGVRSRPQRSVLKTFALALFVCLALGAAAIWTPSS